MAVDGNGGSNEGPSIGGVAAELEAEVAEFEALTRRVTKIELSTRKDLTKMSELLGQAESSHKRFIERLRALIEAIDGVRARQNASAVSLSACADRLDAQRALYENLEQRFAELGEAAKAVNALVLEGAEAGREGGEERATALDKLAAAAERLQGSIEAATMLCSEARSAGLTDVEQQADALRQQLQSLAKKLERVQSAL